MLPANYMSQIPLSILKFIGEHMYYSSKLLKPYRLFNIVAILTTAFFIICEPFMEEKLTRYAEYMESSSVAIQIGIKYLFFIYNKSRIRHLLAELAKIPWDSKDFSRNFLTADQKFQKQIRLAASSFTIHSTIVALVFMLRPAFQKTLFVLETWEVDSIILATTVLALQYYILMLVPTIVMTCDCLYLALCAEIMIQLRRLRHRMERLFQNVDGSFIVRSKFCQLIKWHEHLLRAFRRMQEIYSFMLLFHYYITLQTNCAELYTFLASSKLEVKHLISVLAVVCQFAFYTFPTEALTVEFEKVSTSLYMSHWYKSSLDCQKLLLFTTMRGQVRKCLLGGGIVEVNLRAFTSVLKLSFSLYTLLRKTVYK